MARLIDLRHQGLDRVIGAWAVDGVVIDPGPEPCIENLLAGLDGEAPRALLLTHIHLDHAGGAGALVRRFPELEVYVHELGAPHLADPERLLASAARLYGDDMERLWGEVVPVPDENLRALAGGETVEGFEVHYTPGHASHHVTFIHPRSGDAFVGDVAGVRIPPSALLVPPTPPPDIDVDAWQASLRLVRDASPARLRLAHFGTVEDPPSHLEQVGEELRRWAGLARAADRDSFLSALESEIAGGVAEGDRERVRLAVPPEHIWLGLRRYWELRGVLEREESRA
jgi:glyoxylase-like metal-dependent hydrolase (beta-lactamase superfamily II)